MSGTRGEIRHEPGCRVIFAEPCTCSPTRWVALADIAGWELSDDDPLDVLVTRLFDVAREGVGMDDTHRSLSLSQIRAVLEMLDAAGLVVMEGESR